MKNNPLTFLTRNPIICSVSRTRCIGLAVASLAFAASSQAAVIFTVSDKRPNVTPPSTSLGTINDPSSFDTFAYQVTGLDLTSVGGSASETIAFDVTFSTGAQFNSFGNISVTGGDDNQIQTGETLTATLTLNTANTTFNDSNITLFFTKIEVGGFNNDETWDLVHDGGTINKTTKEETGLLSSFLTIENVDRAGGQIEGINLSLYSIEITAVPEPSSTALLGLGGFALILRRRS